MRIVDWISDVCSSDLVRAEILADPEMAVDPNEDLRSFAEVLDRHIAIDGAGYWDGEIFTGMGSTPSMQEAAMLAAPLDEVLRSEERRVGKRCVSTGRSRGVAVP